MVSAHSFEPGQQNARVGRNGDAALLGNESRGLADQHRIRQSLRRHQHSRDGVHLGLRHEVAAARLKLPLDGFRNRLVHYDGVLRGAQHTVVERLAGDDIADRFLDVCRPLDERGRVPGADAVGRLARAVRGSNEAHAPGREDHGDVAVPHQLLRALERDR